MLFRGFYCDFSMYFLLIFLIYHFILLLSVDVRLPYMVEQFLQNILLMICSIGLVAVVFPWFLIAIGFIFIFFFILLLAFKRTITHIKRVDNVSRSPWFAHLMTTVQSLSTVHAYGKMDSFVKK